jgi:hypothetical protein
VFPMAFQFLCALLSVAPLFPGISGGIVNQSREPSLEFRHRSSAPVGGRTPASTSSPAVFWHLAELCMSPPSQGTTATARCGQPPEPASRGSSAILADVLSDVRHHRPYMSPRTYGDREQRRGGVEPARVPVRSRRVGCEPRAVQE